MMELLPPLCGAVLYKPKSERKSRGGELINNSWSCRKAVFHPDQHHYPKQQSWTCQHGLGRCSGGEGCRTPAKPRKRTRNPIPPEPTYKRYKGLVWRNKQGTITKRR
jgi:hypothetical protein